MAHSQGKGSASGKGESAIVENLLQIQQRFPEIQRDGRLVEHRNDDSGRSNHTLQKASALGCMDRIDITISAKRSFP
jgi:hypothetical protein